MPILENPKHERFAQELAAGRTTDEAYLIAGYKRNDGNAARLKGNDRVSARVREIQATICEGIVIERQWVLAELHKIANAGLGDDQVSVGEKRRALVDIAKMEGWILERHLVSGGLTITHEDALAQLA